ncbi:jasmonate Zim-domain protein [Striga asiatica]|uniref:Protein TIFY n=1 Tax=Striga asiatica TaxID=4170 RepID=A0A5A7QIE2_STRAF|nr:jasmonate Zim-domain protein [Striga asiatica]
MSSFRQFSNGRRQGGALQKPEQNEKSNFVRTCNLLSRYIKEKGSLKDFHIEIGGKIESLQDIIKFLKLAKFFVDPNGFSSDIKEAAISTPKSAQLTIFYSGRVLVFEDYPAGKAQELVAYAKKQSSQVHENAGPSGGQWALSSSPREGLPPRPQPSGSHKAVGIALNNCEVQTNDAVREEQQQATAKNGSDLPIARRSSIHRFLEKRKDRDSARGPYQVHEEPTSSYFKGDEQLELKL